MKRKFYQSRLMLRAGRPRLTMHAPFSAFRLNADETMTLIAHTDTCALCRDHAGWPKDFARAVAGIPPTRLVIYECNPEEAAHLARALANPPIGTL